MKLRAVTAFSEWLRNSPTRFLLLHHHGEYQYRNPNSLFVHRFETFSTKEDAERYLDERIPKAERDDWQLFEEMER